MIDLESDVRELFLDAQEITFLNTYEYRVNGYLRDMERKQEGRKLGADSMYSTLRNRRRKGDPEYLAEKRQQMHKYGQTDTGKAALKAAQDKYRTSEHGRAKRRAYDAAYRAKMKAPA